MTDYDGSTPLEFDETGLEEKYAQFRAAGNTQVAAHVHIGRSNNDSHASRYENGGNGRIIARIRWLNAHAAELMGITPRWIIEQLSNIVTAKAAKDSDKIAATDKLNKHIGFYEADNKQKTAAPVDYTDILKQNGLTPRESNNADNE